MNVKIKRIAASRLALVLATIILTMVCTAAAPAQALETGERMLVPMGGTVGIQMKTNGALVVGISVINTQEGGASPAGDAGILPGDVIIKLGGRDTRSCADLIAAVSELTEDKVSITVIRNDKEIQFTLSPYINEDGSRQLGLWLRDGVTGIGTVTFFDPSTGVYGALGHSISDIDTGIMMPLGSGEIMQSTVIDIRKGKSGAPGELCGKFDHENIKGNILKNTKSGIFGIMDFKEPYNETLPVGEESDIRLGAAKILSNISGTQISEFDVEIIRLYKGDESGRSLMLKITDPELLALTGGIVQGMSGSPIIQDGKLIGAVTHVLINDPAKGYGISIKNMLEASEGGTADNQAA